jgi:tetratricopeptide (TPR) repeat protein
VTEFDESVRLLLELHDLIAAGRGDDPEADTIRDLMEPPWYAMTEAQQQLVNGLSADLYTIGKGPGTGERVSLPTNEIERLVADENWPAVLDLVRSKQELLPSDEAAFTRAVAWMHLGQSEVALRFFRELERLRPLSDAESIWLLTCLMQTGRTEETLEAATRFVDSENPLVRLRASNSLSLAAAKLPGNDERDARRRAIAIAEEAIPHVEPFVSKDRTATLLWRSSLFQLALDYEECGDRQKAVAACQRILSWEHSNLDAQILLDWLTYEEDPNAARERFRVHFRRRLQQPTPDRKLPCFVTDSTV